MAIRNSSTVYIDGINFTGGAVMPLKGAQFLDERLDELMISLRSIRVDNFAPLTPVEIDITNELYWAKRGDGEKRTKKLCLVVAEDNATESPPHSGYYDHELYCLEVTKVAERVIVDSLTFTNDLGNVYADNSSYIQADESSTEV